MTGALAQTMPMLTSGLGIISLLGDQQVEIRSGGLQSPPDACGDGPWYCQLRRFISNHHSNSQVRSKSVTPPDKAVRTVQQTAVLRMVSKMAFRVGTLVHIQDTQAHEQA